MKNLSCLAVMIVAVGMGQGVYAIPSVAPTNMAAVRRAEEINAQDREGNTALNRAVRARNLDEVNRLLDAGADWSIPNLYDEAPLHSAVRLNNYEIVVALLAHGVGVNQTSRGRIPLDFVNSYQNPDENARALRIRDALLGAGSEFRPIPTRVVRDVTLDDVDN